MSLTMTSIDYTLLLSSATPKAGKLGHDPDGPDGNCVSCHMPQRTYMVIMSAPTTVCASPVPT